MLKLRPSVRRHTSPRASRRADGVTADESLLHNAIDATQR